MTGLIFVRFSRPTARIEFTRNVVIAPFNAGQPCAARGKSAAPQAWRRPSSGSVYADEEIKEGETFRRFFYSLKLHFDRLITFPVALTLMHTD